MRKIIILLALLMLAVSQGAYAQSTIFGSVVDAKDGSGIPGVSIIVQGTSIGGVTNSSGNFAIMNVPNDATLQISFIGYKTVEIPVENQTRFNVKLEPDVQVLDEVVVTAARVAPPEKIEVAMGIMRDPKTLTTAVYHMTGDEMRKKGARSFAEGLIGAVPSMRTYRDIDGLIKIAYLRAVTSFQGPQPPLFVLDGMPLKEDPTEWLNMEDIESVTVLPSANAAILYGSQGANGAVIITLKKLWK
jgi:TonB-dependent SusC/RagA subfamily outer membrane receptor